ncbi:Death-on-curing family protein [Lactobacillus helveticus CIRM-BIA 953]|uniref:Death-on-curing family protein n=1 Tax=Lactobacillus helveticus CIRM-BIA 953 TaxID=1226335 RepID=U4QH04_LACHE|nr:Death-on-curing family protein [Lactobacillus helveticus CIRM-BIA 953]
MNDFTKNMAQALFNQDKINDLLRKELQQAVNDLLEAELTAFLGYNPYAEPFDIRPDMDSLITWANSAQNKLHPVQYAADLHYKFVTIHPFRDGNGRTARLLMNLFSINGSRIPCSKYHA